MSGKEETLNHTPNNRYIKYLEDKPLNINQESEKSK